MKRLNTLLCIMMMMCAFSAQAAGPYRVDLPEGDALVTDSGVFLLEPYDGNDIITLSHGKVYLVGSEGAYGIIGGDGEPLSDIEVSMAGFTDGVIIFRENGAYGAMDLEGKILVEPVWTQLVTNGAGGYLALNDDPFDNVADGIIYIDSDGNKESVDNHTVGTLRNVSDGRMVYTTSDGRCGFADEQGKAVTSPGWLYAGDFLDGAAIVSDAHGMGLVDTDGEEILPCAYAYLERNEYIAAALDPDGTLEVYTADGRERLFAIDAGGKYVSVAGSCVSLTDDKGSSLYNRDGRCIYTGSAKASFAEGLNRQIIASDGEWGEACVWIMGTDGKALSGCYQQILPLAGNRYAFLTMKGATYYSQALNDFARSWDYESIRYGMMDGSGQEILEADCLEILAADDDRFILVRQDGTHLADESGGIIKSWYLPEQDLSSSE